MKKLVRDPPTELVLELEYLKIETRLITEMFANVMGECVAVAVATRSKKDECVYYESMKRKLI